MGATTVVALQDRLTQAGQTCKSQMCDEPKKDCLQQLYRLFSSSIFGFPGSSITPVVSQSLTNTSCQCLEGVKVSWKFQSVLIKKTCMCPHLFQ